MKTIPTLTSITACLGVALGGACSRDAAADKDVPELDIVLDRVDELPGDDPVRVTWLPTAIVDPGADDPVPVTEAIAVLHPTQGSEVTGTVRFRQSARGLEVFATVRGLAPGRHAYHVHVFGDCSSPDATSAGPHFHFEGSAFDPDAKIITGNLGELRATRGDRVTHHARIPDATLQGSFTILGRSVVVHARGNDPTQPPAGGAGERLACGVIGVDGAPPPDART